eukprot:PhF_6_TR41325/c0_g1_i1/m.62638/K04990/PKD2L1; polycystin 2L1
MRAVRAAASVHGGRGNHIGKRGNDIDPNERILLESLTNYLKFQMRKIHAYRSFPLYLVFISFIVTATLLPASTLPSALSMVSFHEDLIGVTTLSDVTTPTEVYNWLDSISMLLWNDTFTKRASTTPIEALRLTQRSVGLRPCDHGGVHWAVLSQYTAQFSKFLCFDFSNTTESEINLMYSAPLSQVQQNLTLMKNTNYLHEGTIELSVDIVSFNAPLDGFVSMRIQFSFHAGGWVTSTVTAVPFQIRSLNTDYDRGALAVDCCIAFLAFLQFLSIARTVRFEYQLTRSLIKSLTSFWVIYQFVVVLVVLSAIIIRFMLLRGTEDWLSARQNTLVDFLYHYSEQSKRVQILLGWDLLLAFHNMFMYLQYNSKLSVVNETLRSSLGDLFGVGIVTIWVVVSFGISGHAFWGYLQPNFSTVGNSIVYLSQLMISGDVQDYLSFERNLPNVAPAFFALFFIITWLVLLNVIVGIIAASFGAVMDTHFRHNSNAWSITSLARDVKLLYGRMRTGTFTTTERGDDPLVVHAQIIELLELRTKQGGEDPHHIKVSEFEKICKDRLDTVEVRRAVEKAFAQVGTTNAKLRQLRNMERGGEEARKINTQIEAQIRLTSEMHRHMKSNRHTTASTAGSGTVDHNSLTVNNAEGVVTGGGDSPTPQGGRSVAGDVEHNPTDPFGNMGPGATFVVPWHFHDGEQRGAVAHVNPLPPQKMSPGATEPTAVAQNIDNTRDPVYQSKAFVELQRDIDDIKHLLGLILHTQSVGIGNGPVVVGAMSTVPSETGDE